MEIETRAIHAGRQVDPATGAVVPPLYLSTTFEREADGSYPHNYNYIRDRNPNRVMLEDCLCALEGGKVASAFASGSAATMSIFQALNPGDRVVVPHDAYSGTGTLLRSLMQPWGLKVAFADMTNLQEVKAAITSDTRLVWLETPSNPMLKITDIGAVTAIAHKVGALSVCDNTWATPVLQQPFALGCDLVVHSTTKYLGGHSDVLGGAIIAQKESEFFEKVLHIQHIGGAVPSPFDCWLILRGIATLPYRMKGHCENADKLARWLQQHRAIARVHYPGLSTHSGYAIASQQMSGFGGMLSVELKGGKEAAFAMAAHVKLFRRATSLGGVESLIEHRASIEGKNTRTPDSLLRLSVGLENAEDLIADCDRALKGNP
ncbi:trans-sulfuration enzyme family protein [Spirulina sp. 06S082]|uniref:trans-sulfuration enzyme family protein n=1 Tax=Spirulina sp. 06S082 TaxID=3110248 RepID=UPI002B1EE284|nr:aminotransferase class V-fold PLP-dependent enzyme [Spirulina sp. 06S082]MEA5468161.1 aminotransferase class V-fold PLP-dependent enzyme [Spirulina sp. 06S082]